jgi:hypothetical protein
LGRACTHLCVGRHISSSASFTPPKAFGALAEPHHRKRHAGQSSVIVTTRAPGSASVAQFSSCWDVAPGTTAVVRVRQHPLRFEVTPVRTSARMAGECAAGFTVGDVVVVHGTSDQGASAKFPWLTKSVLTVMGAESHGAARVQRMIASDKAVQTNLFRVGKKRFAWGW